MMEGRRKQGEIVGVRFTPSGKVYFFAPGNVVVSVGDRVEVETDIGYREGTAGPGAGRARTRWCGMPISRAGSGDTAFVVRKLE